MKFKTANPHLLHAMILKCFIFIIMVPWVCSESKSDVDILKRFHQSEYILTPERAEVVQYNKNYMHFLEIKTFKYNRTCTAFNITMNYEVDPNKMQVITQVYKFMSNEYRLFPLRIQYHYCTAVDQNIAGIAKVPCGNFTGCSAPLRTTYKVCNWTPDETKLPPLIPPGRYMAELQFIYHTNEVALARAYASVTVPIYYPK